MQYRTSIPALVHSATVPAPPKSMSSGWATTTSTRSISSSGRGSAVGTVGTVTQTTLTGGPGGHSGTHGVRWHVRSAGRRPRRRSPGGSGRVGRGAWCRGAVVCHPAWAGRRGPELPLYAGRAVLAVLREQAVSGCGGSPPRRARAAASRRRGGRVLARVRGERQAGHHRPPHAAAPLRSVDGRLVPR